MRIARLFLIGLSGLLIAFDVLYLFELITGRISSRAAEHSKFVIYFAPVLLLLFASMLLNFAANMNKKIKKKKAYKLADSLAD
jgi:predicted membrane channel-forming protein YqfA (hemolysin III family)